MIKEQIKMDGLALDDPIVLYGLDSSMVEEDKKQSLVYRSGKKNRISEGDFTVLLSHIRHNIESSLWRMLDGEITASPVVKNGKKGLASCRFCRYASICRFEEELGDRYRPLYEYKDEEILERLRRDYKEGIDEE